MSIKRPAMKQLFHFSGPLLAALSVAACSFNPIDRPQIVASPDSVSLRLSEAADKAATALETLAAVEQARTPGVSVGPISGAPPELRRAMTVNWTGPVEPLAKRLADRASYGFLVLGGAPPVPLVVVVDAENRPVVDILRDVGLQLGLRADVKVDVGRRMVEIHYAPNTGMGG